MAKNLKQEEQDFVISTVPLTLDDIDVIQVSVVLNNRDVERIQKYVEKKETVLETEDEIYTCLKEFLHEEISIFNCDLRTREEAIYLLGNRMIYEGYADEEYVSSVFEREKISDTYMSSFIAIPHSFVGHTKKEGIGIMTLKKPIPWGNGQVRIVFMLALDSGAENKIFQKIFGAIYNLTRTQKDVDKILKADSLKKLKNSLTESSKFPTSNA